MSEAGLGGASVAGRAAGADAAGERYLRFLGLAAMVVGGALIVFTRAKGLLTNPDAWFDEAMLTLNFLRGSWSGLFSPQPYFEQATSLGYLVVGRLAASVSPAHVVIILRSISAFASLACAALLFLALRKARPRLEAALTVTFAMLAPSLIFQSVETKAYILEALCTSAIIFATLKAQQRREDSKSLALLGVVSAAALVFSNSAIFILAGFGAALFIFVALERPLDMRRLGWVAVTGVLLAAWAAVIYLVYTKPAVAIQIQAYAYELVEGKLPIPSIGRETLHAWTNFLALLDSPFFLGYNKIARWALAALTVVGVVASLKDRSAPTRLLGVGGVLALVGVATTATVGFFTPFAERHVVFLVPIMAFFIILGLRTVVWALAPSAVRERLAPVVLTALVFAYGGYQLGSASDMSREPIRPLLQRAAALKAWPDKTWVYYGAQPAVDLARYPVVAPYLGRISDATSPTGWMRDVRGNYRAYLDRFRSEMVGRNEIYILTAHVHGQEAAQLLAAARASVGPCEVVMSTTGTRGAPELDHCARGGETSVPTAPPASPPRPPRAPPA